MSSYGQNTSISITKNMTKENNSKTSKNSNDTLSTHLNNLPPNLLDTIFKTTISERMMHQHALEKIKQFFNGKQIINPPIKKTSI